MTNNDLNLLKSLLDKLICEQEDLGTASGARRAGVLRNAYEVTDREIEELGRAR